MRRRKTTTERHVEAVAGLATARRHVEVATERRRQQRASAGRGDREGKGLGHWTSSGADAGLLLRLKTVLQTSRKCLCVLVKDRDDPNLGLKINVTKALALPSLCNAPANISECPSTPFLSLHHNIILQ
ncbi:hypothetical protein GUJ93_ZPchr0007g3206 [Zizania palustris]|uniref:Bifunctional inhibitor/plant lipid transfer protein/seed storage helical domain-containing protein n=1 Tax=Zizania palustris TaxID=103762 RepID=A0A8J5VUA1_ZIZPA|nr:hypothetical protein GUJ93_ZPchr0007g3206 [Zizania palustris]